MENQTTGSLPTLKTSDVLALLRQGKSRQEIEEHYGMNKATAKALWSSPGLKRKKQAKQGKEVKFIIEDDVQTEPKVAKQPKVVDATEDAPALAVAENREVRPETTPAPVPGDTPAEVVSAGGSTSEGGWGS